MKRTAIEKRLAMQQNPFEAQVAIDTLERYSGCPIEHFQENLLLTNFPRYVDYFAESRNVNVHQGAMFKVAHCKKEKVTMLDFKIGSPAAALVVDVCSFLPFETSLFLGMCGGLRKRYKIGEYLVPVASIRAEGTSDNYFSGIIPALGNFLIQKAVTQVLQEEKAIHHVGITYTTNLRFWEFDEDFILAVKKSRAQGIEMECATLFMASYKRKLTLGALLLISDLPLETKGIKTKKRAEMIFQNHMHDHVEKGIKIIHYAREMQKKSIKGSYHIDEEEV